MSNIGCLWWYWSCFCPLFRVEYCPLCCYSLEGTIPNVVKLEYLNSTTKDDFPFETMFACLCCKEAEVDEQSLKWSLTLLDVLSWLRVLIPFVILHFLDSWSLLYDVLSYDNNVQSTSVFLNYDYFQYYNALNMISTSVISHVWEHKIMSLNSLPVVFGIDLFISVSLVPRSSSL